MIATSPQIHDAGALAAIVVKLLDDAGRALDGDRQAAAAAIARASALLQADRDRWSAQTDSGAAEPARGGLAPWQIRKVKAHIEDNLDATVRVEDFTAITRLSARYFSCAFKRSFGEPPHAYLVRRRIEKAQEMMLTTDETLSQIALACGLSDQAHLSRLFRRATGATPNAWRRERRGEPQLRFAA